MQGWSRELVEELDPSADPEAFKTMQAETGKNTVPQIFVAWSTGRAEYIGGYDTLSEWCASLPLPLAAALNVASASAATTRLTRCLLFVVCQGQEWQARRGARKSRWASRGPTRLVWVSARNASCS